MAQTLLRDKARMLRKKGASLEEIVAQLGSAKSTVRYWCRDITLSDAQQRRLFDKQRLGGVRAAEAIRKARIEATEQLRKEGMSEIGKISTRELCLVGTALYWAEGYRKGDGEFGFTNSDPHMIRLIIEWLQRTCGVSKDRIHARICINAEHAKRLTAIKKFWVSITGISESQFSLPTLIKIDNHKQFLSADKYFGTLRIKVRKSTNVRRKIMGMIDGLIHGVGV